MTQMARCVVCGAVDGLEWVYFADYDPGWLARRYPDGAVPPGGEDAPGFDCFCPRHIVAARGLRDVTVAEARGRLWETFSGDQSSPPRSDGPDVENADGGGDPDPTSIFCGRCGELVHPSFVHCPWCGNEVRSPVQAAVARGWLAPAPFEPRWPYSDWRGEGAGAEAPPCPHCGQPVRGSGAERARPFPGEANPPWNAGWDGSCEACGVRIELTVHTPLHFNVDRTTIFRPASRPCQTFIDEGFVLSGIEVTVTHRERVNGRDPTGSEPAPRTETLFLSMAEITRLADALQGELQPFLAQLDWAHDWT